MLFKITFQWWKQQYSTGVLFLYNVANDADGATWGSNVEIGPGATFGDIHVIAILNINDEIGVVLNSNTVDEIQYFLQLSAATYNIDFIADL